MTLQAWGCNNFLDFIHKYPEKIELIYGKLIPGTPFERIVIERLNQHLQVTPELDNRNAGLYMYAHSASELSLAFHSNLTGYSNGTITPHQQYRLDDLKELINASLDHRPEDLDLVEFFRAFDELLFFSALGNLCAVKFIYPEPTIQEEEVPRGLYRARFHRDQETIPYNVAGQIMIHKDTETGPSEARRRNYVSCLLHEMIHAFLDIYLCNCIENCEHTLYTFFGGGRSGHSKAFHEIALSIERFGCIFLQELGPPHLCRCTSFEDDWIMELKKGVLVMPNVENVMEDLELCHRKEALDAVMKAEAILYREEKRAGRLQERETRARVKSQTRSKHCFRHMVRKIISLGSQPKLEQMADG